jgi:hypothetical protein
MFGVVLFVNRLTPAHLYSQNLGSLALRQVAVKQSVTAKVTFFPSLAGSVPGDVAVDFRHNAWTQYTLIEIACYSWHIGAGEVSVDRCRASAF